MSSPPFIACLCPTFRRPSSLVANAVACFLNQTYPAERRKLVVLDDSDELESVSGENWSIFSVKERYESLPDKYHALVEMAGEADAYCIWEDDECFLPKHLEAHSLALDSKMWSHPKFIHVIFGKHSVEPAGRRFHSSLAFTREAYKVTGGWPRTKRPDFDLQFLQNLRDSFGPPGNPSEFFGPTYAFRWPTGSYHGQEFMNGQNEDWWDLVEQKAEGQGKGRVIVPELDENTKSLYERFGEGTQNV